MSETVDANMISRRHALSVFGLAVALLPATALGGSDAQAQTPGMERREQRREDRGDRREGRRENRQDRREDRRESRQELRDERQKSTGGY